MAHLHGNTISKCHLECNLELPKDLQQLEFNTLEGDGLPSLAEMERRYIMRVLDSTGYNKGITAQILNIPRTTLWRKIKQYGL